MRELEWITARRSEPGTLADELAEQLQEVRDERVLNLPADAFSGGGDGPGSDAPG
ncbi:hypothetical protein ACSCB1_34375 [Streptomyces europaeiscabiei]|uniref:Transposase n=1 Tax=Streptomyces europaeiscabiei TaxID=146819 RepID=A0ABU4NHT3_9ACTN|nr:hypothetical protein [Streptomyces europaeiscabiei]MDX2529769.1 hypothetical protein [Streptomyces europaeiscabiei]MDX2756921.1 hypothetical protein [Streptomyces europaeiscabiei]MDX2756996.1 hypothetical protein [Streptomyces europaeiscabiei]MDX2766690.1 hypothetical protein [Streptomyces europaeiscabiei]MDX3544183.1 hypothetical protein [Streptomyces europaeiscabiei]